MTKNAYVYATFRINLFGDWLSFSYSFLQNVLAKILSINNIYSSLKLGYELQQWDYIYFDFGRLLRVLTVFDPIELENPEQDWYYNA
jgi:hypothetical protein